MPPVTSWTNHSEKGLLKLDVKNIAYAKTLFFKKLKNTSQESTPS